jgi:hypothetical protein
MSSSFVRHVLAFQFLVGLAFLVATPSVAQFSQNEMVCFGLLPGQPDQQVTACTAVIEAGGDVTKLSHARCNRGVWNQARGHLDRAVADYDELIGLLMLGACVTGQECGSTNFDKRIGQRARFGHNFPPFRQMRTPKTDFEFDRSFLRHG